MTETPQSPWPRPSGETLTGNYVILTTLDWYQHGYDLAERITGTEHDALWDYIPIGPFADLEELQATYEPVRLRSDWVTMVIIDIATERALGMCSFMRIRPQYGSVEIGCVVFGQDLQKKTGATEAVYLMAKYAFETLGYRRFEWKCHNENDASKQAALRFGFTYEGLFRKDMMFKGRNRDTAWYSMIDDEWPVIRAAFEAWLDPANFDSIGQQRTSLADCRTN